MQARHVALIVVGIVEKLSCGSGRSAAEDFSALAALNDRR
jgi:hypothetical protein